MNGRVPISAHALVPVAAALPLLPPPSSVSHPHRVQELFTSGCRGSRSVPLQVRHSIERAPFLLEQEKVKMCPWQPGGVAVFDFSAAAVPVSGCAFSPSSPKVEGTAPHPCLLAFPAHRTCAASLPFSLKLGSEVDAEKKKCGLIRAQLRPFLRSREMSGC